MPRKVKLSNPKSIFFSSNGQAVRGHRVVRFEDPVPADVHQRIAAGFLVETDEEPSPDRPAPAKAQAPTKAKASELEALRKEIAELKSQTAGNSAADTSKELEELRTQVEELTAQVNALKEGAQPADGEGGESEASAGAEGPKTTRTARTPKSQSQEEGEK